MANIDNPIVSRFIRGLGANGVTQLSQIIMRLAEIPLMLTFWGASGYGEWLMIMALPTALLLSDGGITKTAQREMIMCAGRGDFLHAASVFQSTWAALLLLSPAIILLVAASGHFLPVHAWLKIQSISSDEFVYTITLLTTQVLIQFQCSLLRGIFSARGRYATGELYQTLSTVISFTLMAISVLNGGDMVQASACLMLGSLAGYILIYIRAHTLDREIRYGLKHSSLSTAKSLALPSLANIAFPLSDAINMLGTRLLVGVLLGPASLATFSSLRTLCRLALQPVLSVARTIEPEFALAYGSGNYERVRTLLVKGSQLAAWFSALLCLAMLIIGQYAFEIWTKDQLKFDWITFSILLLASFINAFWSVSLALVCSTNRHLTLSLVYFSTQGLICIATAWAFTSKFEHLGPATGVVLAEVMTCIATVMAASKLTGQPIWPWIKRVFTPSLDEFKYITRYRKEKLILSPSDK
ncbi:lipopolysaccharide biosynthesis protein [Pseudomonas sp. GCM10022186]|uniref:lipopolysaccharide biosynthesis protein n=1 Tax=Pseudomonas sp. GCM10022186 TaxID=3252650 RepID=UPI0036195877